MSDAGDVTPVEHDHSPFLASVGSSRPGLWLDRGTDGVWRVMGPGKDGAEVVLYVSGLDQQQALTDLQVYERAARSSPSS